MIEYLLYFLNEGEVFCVITKHRNWQGIEFEYAKAIPYTMRNEWHTKIDSCPMLQNRSSSSFCLIFVLQDYDKV